jgi:hypothetical protein
MELNKLLSEQAVDILDAACKSLSRAKLRSYSCSEESENRKRFERLLELTIECIVRKNSFPIVSYIEQTARERFYAGFDFSEVHSAINVLEEILWNNINNNSRPEDLVEYLGFVSTVLGAAKGSLARTYISLASKTKVETLDLNAMFGRN